MATSGWATVKSSSSSNVIANNITIASGTNNADTIQASSISNTVRAINGNSGNDLISVEGGYYAIEYSSSSLIGGSGKDTIYIKGSVDGIHPSKVNIDAGDSSDFVSIYGGNEGIHGGTIGVSEKSSVKIDLGSGSDSLIIHGDNDKGIDISQVTINGGAGNDLISIYGGNYGIGGNSVYGNSTVSINGGSGTDTIAISSVDSLSDVTINAGAGDVISVISGEVNYLFDSTNEVTINGSEFKAKSSKSIANLATEANSITLNSSWNGNVEILNGSKITDIDGISKSLGSYSIVNGKFSISSSENQSVNNSISSYSTVDAIVNLDSVSGSKKGSFVINSSSTQSNLAYIADFVTVSSINDVLVGKVTNNKNYIATNNLNKQIINVEDKWTVTGSSNADSIYITSDEVSLNSNSGNDTINNKGQYVTINAGDGDNTIQNGDDSASNKYGFYTYIISGKGNDTITNNGRYSTIIAGAGDDSIYTDIHSSDGSEGWRDVTVFGGDGNDTLQVNDHETSLNGGAGNDIISVEGGINRWNTNTLQGGKDNDTIYGGSANVFYYDDGDGDDLVYNFANGDTLQINANRYSSVKSGDDVVFTIGQGHITLVGAASLSANVVDGYEVNVELSKAGNKSSGVFVVNYSTLESGDVIFNSSAEFKSSARSGDILIGSLSGSKNYIAVEDSDYRQSIKIPSSWKVSSTQNSDVLNISGSNVTLNGNDDSDLFSIGSSVRNVTINDFTHSGSDADHISFESSVASGSFNAVYGSNSVSLTSNKLNIIFNGYHTLNSSFLNSTIDNGGISNTFRELIGDSHSSGVDVIVDLNTVKGSNTGSFIINDSSSKRDGAYISKFVTLSSSDDSIVGNVNKSKTYSATNSVGKQGINVPKSWAITASSNSDSINVNGDYVTLTSGAGRDTINIGSSVKNVRLTDLSTSNDKLKFNKKIANNSLSTVAGSNSVTLKSSSINIILDGITKLNNSYLNYTVDNNGTSTALKDLLKIDTSSIMKPSAFNRNDFNRTIINDSNLISNDNNRNISLSRWNYGFNPDTGRRRR